MLNSHELGNLLIIIIRLNVSQIQSNIFLKGISMDKLSCKINEFNAENEMLRCSLKQAKGEFIKELNDIIEFMR